MSTRVDDAMLPRQYRIDRVRKETNDTFTMELVPANGCKEVAFLPGQFNMLYVYGVGEVPISISGNPSKHKKLIHTTRAVGSVTNAMQKMKKGGIIGVRGPFGTSWPVEKAHKHDVVIIAGGIGLAPLRPAIYKILDDRAQFGKVVLLYGTRTPSDILFRRELEQWRSRLDMEVYVTVDRASGDWRGNVGVVTTLIPQAPFDPTNTIAFICGPEIMMRFTILELQKRGVTRDNIYVSMERNMKCGIGLCGHCQLRETFICKDGPVFNYNDIEELFGKREI